MIETWTFTFRDKSYTAVRPDTQTLHDFIEEQLYILWELHPCERDWYYELSKQLLVTQFHYCDEPENDVVIDTVDHTVTVSEWEVDTDYDWFLDVYIGCHADENGNRPCDNGVPCDRCMTKEAQEALNDMEKIFALYGGEN